MPQDKQYGFDTLALHAGHEVDTTGSRAVPLHRTAAYLFRDTEHAANLFALKELGNIYTRLGGPTQDVLEQRMAALEGGAAALALASGTTAIHYSVTNICKQGDQLVASANLYGGTYTMFDSILPQSGITTRFADFTDPAAIRAAITDKTRLLFTEVIGNPTLDVVNIAQVAEIAREHNLPLIVDSTFSPPSMFRPLEHGANIVVHSLTKWLGGHGTAIGGVVIDGANFDWTDPKFTLFNEPDSSYHGMRYAHDLGELSPLAFILRMRLVPLRNLGGCLSPDNAWIFLQGIETLALRMQRHCDNAAKVAAFLADHPMVSWVRFPGLEGDPGHAAAKAQFGNCFGGMVVFGITSGEGGCLQAGQTFIDRLQLLSHLANVGDAKSLAIHPASTTHSQLSAQQMEAGGIGNDLIRLSIGIENVEDIIADLDQALSGACQT